MPHLERVIDYEIQQLVDMEDECTQLMIDMWGLKAKISRSARVRRLIKDIPRQKLKIKLLEARLAKEAL